MNSGFKKLICVAPYLILAVAAGASFYSFTRTDQLRQQTETILSQTYEIQWRASQSREKIANISGYLQLLIKTGEQQPFLKWEADLLAFNLQSLLDLGYTASFLDERNMQRLKSSQTAIDAELIPLIESGRYDEALQSATRIKRDLFILSGATVEHGQALTAKTKIETDVARIKFELAAGLAVLVVVGLFLQQRNLHARRKDQHIRSFSALFAHMTRTRVAALRLFLGRLANNVTLSSEMVDAARTTIAELESINEALMTIGHAKNQSRCLPLKEILEDLETSYPVKPRLDIEQAAREALVPASQFHLLIDELVRNSVNAVSQKPDPVILIKANIRRRVLRGPQLVLVFTDNGIGMNPSTLAKAPEPFFSTKAGVHVGLGLTNCVEMVKTMAGTLKMTSVPGAGTAVRVTYSL